MLDLGDVAQWWADLVVDGMVSRAIRRRRRRRVDAAVAAGRAATFPGWVLGSRPCCRPTGGLLVVTHEDQVGHVERAITRG
ncbi:hypothetical protein Q760_11205 [Cellulomonas cellasea DSM 20118]|uniref:Uncharacterized protein n=2 Tax=Cellulomonas cellasea TaxID=43670 RepID=A0A0A0B9D4_9CELL|nr:hypothetical protein Q760_11205 [Cellulomonas cellasea DSM 20118]GEA87647.1 hypothetical protein CCE01nite_15960 [Cellulomonas cellasea]